MATTQYDRPLTQLTAAGTSTTAVDKIGAFENHSMSVKVAAITTNVVVGITGSIDGTNYFEVPFSNTAVANCALTANRATITANGTYLLQANSTKLKLIRLTWYTEADGTAATINVHYFGGH